MEEGGFQRERLGELVSRDTEISIPDLSVLLWFLLGVNAVSFDKFCLSLTVFCSIMSLMSLFGCTLGNTELFHSILCILGLACKNMIDKMESRVLVL